MVLPVGQWVVGSGLGTGHTTRHHSDPSEYMGSHINRKYTCPPALISSTEYSTAVAPPRIVRAGGKCPLYARSRNSRLFAWAATDRGRIR